MKNVTRRTLTRAFKSSFVIVKADDEQICPQFFLYFANLSLILHFAIFPVFRCFKRNPASFILIYKAALRAGRPPRY